MRDIEMYRPTSSRHLGSVRDPSTGEMVDVYAAPMPTNLPYRRSDGSFGDMRSEESDAAWPNGGLWTLYTSNGRAFGENYFDHDGWWCNTDVRYLPLARHRCRAMRFLAQVVEGRRNGFPWCDVLAFATGWSLRSSRSRKAES